MGWFAKTVDYSGEMCMKFSYETNWSLANSFWKPQAFKFDSNPNTNSQPSKKDLGSPWEQKSSICSTGETQHAEIHEVVRWEIDLREIFATEILLWCFCRRCKVCSGNMDLPIVKLPMFLCSSFLGGASAAAVLSSSLALSVVASGLFFSSLATSCLVEVDVS